MPDQKTKSVQNQQDSGPVSLEASTEDLGVQQLADPLSDPLGVQFSNTAPEATGGAAGAPGDPSGSSSVMFSGGKGSVHQTAAQGVSGGGGSLPFGDQIQQSFGGHDISGVKAHTGSAATAANKAMGSSAYATGTNVAFKGSPDLHTAAHEAAHVVQQRAGVNLPGGVGSRGDSYEQHADAVADNVVQGKSAAPLLDNFVGTAKAATVQKQSAGAVQFGIWDTITGAWNKVTGGGDKKDGGKSDVKAKTEGEKQFELAEKFAGKGKYGDPYKYTPTTGLGGFDSEYYPKSGPDGLQKVIQRCAVHFISPVKMSGKNAAVTEPGDAVGTSIAADINSMPEGKRKAEVDRYQWGAEKSGYLAKISKMTAAVWDQKHSFRIEKPGWKWVGATPKTDITCRESKTKGKAEHMLIKLYKMPVGKGAGAELGGSGRNQQMIIDSNSFADKPKAWGHTVMFDTGKSALTATHKSHMAGFTRTYQGDPSNGASAKNKIVLTGSASASGSKASNRKLSAARIKAVSDELKTLGWDVKSRIETINQGEDKANQSKPDNKHDRTVRMDVKGTGQTTVAHEFGHAFGLRDEYAVSDKKGTPGWVMGTGGQTGKETGHSKLAKKSGVKDGAIYENNENIMSIGNKVKPQHYATFWEALTKTTGRTDFQVGKPISKDKAKAEVTPAKDKATK